jgi:hypothetical protein
MEHENNNQQYGGHMSAHLHNNKIQGVVVVTLALLSLFLVSLIITEVREWRYLGSGLMPANTINVQGEGEVFAVPDTASFSFSVIKEGANVEEVQESAAKVSNEVIEYLKENGIEEKDIKTVGYNVYPMYEWEQIVCVAYPCPQGERKLVGFEINQSFTVKVRDTKKAGELLSGVGGFGVENISGVSFTIDDEDALNREVRQLAVKDAKEKAQALADDLGVRLVRVVNFNEYNVPYYARYDSKSSVMGMGGEGAVLPELPVGENQIISQVNITYEIR